MVAICSVCMGCRLANMRCCSVGKGCPPVCTGCTLTNPQSSPTSQSFKQEDWTCTTHASTRSPPQAHCARSSHPNLVHNHLPTSHTHINHIPTTQARRLDMHKSSIHLELTSCLLSTFQPPKQEDWTCTTQNPKP